MTLGVDEFFVVGDNQGHSIDSRTFGPVARGEILGRARFVHFSRVSAGCTVRWDRIGRRLDERPLLATFR